MFTSFVDQIDSTVFTRDSQRKHGSSKFVAMITKMRPSFVPNCKLEHVAMSRKYHLESGGMRLDSDCEQNTRIIGIVCY
jgi:hypothetical protein